MIRPHLYFSKSCTSPHRAILAYHIIVRYLSFFQAVSSILILNPQIFKQTDKEKPQWTETAQPKPSTQVPTAQSATQKEATVSTRRLIKLYVPSSLQNFTGSTSPSETEADQRQRHQQARKLKGPARQHSRKMAR